jgi:3-oxoadipate enol-lactonase / 4-carboxymuconolactone decarboxylase
MTIELSTRTEGPPGAPVLVLLNSLGATTAMWDPVVGPLAEQFQVVRLDTRGHGDSPASPATTALTIADLGADVLAVLDRVQAELGVARVHVAGVSLGGMVATWLAIHHPERVARLALVCTSARLEPAQGWLDRAATVRTSGLDAVVDPIQSRWTTPALAKRDPALMKEMRAAFTATDAESYAQCCEALAVMDLRADLHRIAAPTLVVAAAEDTAIPPVNSYTLHEAISGSRIELIAGAAHIPTLDQPAILVSLLLEHFGAGATLAAGMRTRRAVLGDEHVDRAVLATTDLTAPFQEFITRFAWGDVWSRPGLARRDRSLVTLAALVVLGAEHEIPLHVRGAVRNGLRPDEIGEVLLHCAVYGGVPRANSAFAIAQRVLEELDSADSIEES